MDKLSSKLVAGICLWITAASASALVFEVDSTLDAVDADLNDNLCITASGDCSLRAAIQQANASTGPHIINVADGVYNLSNVGDQEDTALTGDLDVLADITLNGTGADLVAIDGMRSDRVFHVHTDARLVVNAVTIRNGWIMQNSSGGGIDNRGELEVNDSNIVRNYAPGMGGGINNFMGTVTINRSTIADNATENTGAGINSQDGDVTINQTTIRDNGGYMFPGVILGGGIFNSALFNTLEINDSTISGHSVYVDGGGVYHLLGTLLMSNTTITDNFAGRNGGGLYHANGNSNYGLHNKLVNITIANNDAQGIDSGNGGLGKGGGGLYNVGAVPLNIANSIIAENGFGNDCYDGGIISSLGNNLDSDGTCGWGISSNSIANGNAALSSLADNGGPVETLALVASSDAVNSADNTQCPSLDARGHLRPLSDCDMGAFELGAVAPGAPVAGPPANNGTSTDGGNTAPQAFTLPIAVQPGGTVHAVANGTDADGDPLTYTFVQLPTQGKVGWDNQIDDNGIPGAFTYVAGASASGVDQFSFRACDEISCSDPAIIMISISEATVNGSLGIELAPDTGDLSPVQVVVGGALTAVVGDVDFTRPLGVFFFSVDNIPLTPDNIINGITVTLQLPAGSNIAANAVVRKMDNTGTWQTLQSDPSPNISTGSIDLGANTLTLILRDNDMFDLDPQVGVIMDPVAIGIPKAVITGTQDQAGNQARDSGVGALPLAWLLMLAGVFVCRQRYRALE